MIPSTEHLNTGIAHATASAPAQRVTSSAEFFPCGKRKSSAKLSKLAMKRSLDSSDMVIASDEPETKRAKLVPSLVLSLPCIKSSNAPVPSTSPSVPRRAHLKLPFFKLEDSKQMAALEAHILVTRTEDTQNHDARSIAVCVSKFLRFSDKESKANADQVDWLTHLRDSKTVMAFLGKLADAKFSGAAQAKYVSANAKAVDFLLMQSLSLEQRAAVQQTAQWYKMMLKAKLKNGRKSTKSNQKRETLEAKGLWITLAEFGQVNGLAQTKADEIEAAIESNPELMTPRVGSFYRSLLVVSCLAMSKIARCMNYYALDAKAWTEAKRDEQGRKLITTDAFKTASTYGTDAIVFDKTTEARMNFYLKHVRPVFVTAESKEPALFVTQDGKRHKRLTDDIAKLCSHALGRPGINVTALRKALATEAAQKCTTEEQATIALNDKHSMAVVKSNYEKIAAVSAATKAFDLQQRLMQPSASSSSVTLSASAAVTSPMAASSSTLSVSLSASAIVQLPVAQVQAPLPAPVPPAQPAPLNPQPDADVVPADVKAQAQDPPLDEKVLAVLRSLTTRGGKEFNLATDSAIYLFMKATAAGTRTNWSAFAAAKPIIAAGGFKSEEVRSRARVMQKALAKAKIE